MFGNKNFGKLRDLAAKKKQKSATMGEHMANIGRPPRTTMPIERPSQGTLPDPIIKNPPSNLAEPVLNLSNPKPVQPSIGGSSIVSGRKPMPSRVFSDENLKEDISYDQDEIQKQIDKFTKLKDMLVKKKGC